MRILVGEAGSNTRLSCFVMGLQVCENSRIFEHLGERDNRVFGDPW